jgi:multicomponent Na+:H+ antiporter subunit D
VSAALTVLAPFLAACALAGLSPFVRRRAGWTAVVVALAALGLAIATAAHGQTVVWFGGWTPRHGVALGVSFAVDALGAGFAVFVTALGVVALVVATRVIQVETPLFDAVLLVWIGAMAGFCLTGDLFNLFVFFELMSVAAYVLVGYEIGKRAALEGALTFAVTNTVGSILLLFGIGLLYGRTGALNLAQMGNALQSGPHDALVAVAFAFVACGLLVKAAVVPFHLWTADAYAVAPTPVCILLAGAFSELGLFGLARVYWTVFAGVFAHLETVLLVAGLLTAVVGALMCGVQHHLKRMLAFATIAHVGLFLTGIALLTPDGLAGTAIWVVADGLVKAGLFCCLAVVQHRHGSVEVAEVFGRGSRRLGIVFVAGALCVASLPPTGSFLGKALVEDAAPPWAPPILMLVTGLVAGTLLRAAARVFWGIGEAPPADPAGDEPEDEPVREEGGARSLAAGAVVLTAAGAAWGLVPGLAAAAGRAAAAFTDRRGYAAAVLEGRVVPHAIHVPGPSAAAYAYAAGSLAVAGVTAWLGVRRTLAIPRPLDGLRRLHSGHPGDYVAWTVAGAAVLGGVLVTWGS